MIVAGRQLTVILSTVARLFGGVFPSWETSHAVSHCARGHRSVPGAKRFVLPPIAGVSVSLRGDHRSGGCELPRIRWLVGVTPPWARVADIPDGV